MTSVEALYLVGVITAFAVFIAALAWAARDYSRSAPPKPAAGED